MMMGFRDWWDAGAYRRSLSRAQRPQFSAQDLARDSYFSQSGQDKWVIETLRPGVFVDIGAHDGVSFSNTYALERLGWTGLAVEPIPEAYARLVANRRCATLCGCIGAPAGRRRFRRVEGYAEMLSGLVADCDPRHETRIAGEVAREGGAVREIEVECYDIHAALAAHGLPRVDYLSIDVEGGEAAILRSIDFTRVDIAIIGVENNYDDPAAWRVLTRSGYALHSKVGADEFYVRRQK